MLPLKIISNTSIIIVTIIMSGCTSTVEANQIYRYSSLDDSFYFGLNTKDQTSNIVSKGAIDRVPARTRVDNSRGDWIGFSGGIFPSFAVPKDIENTGKKWRYYETDFEIINTLESGAGNKVYVISAQDETEVRHIFYFDEQEGLRMIFYVNEVIQMPIGKSGNHKDIYSFNDILIADGAGFGEAK